MSVCFHCTSFVPFLFLRVFPRVAFSSPPTAITHDLGLRTPDADYPLGHEESMEDHAAPRWDLSVSHVPSPAAFYHTRRPLQQRPRGGSDEACSVRREPRCVPARHQARCGRTRQYHTPLCRATWGNWEPRISLCRMGQPSFRSSLGRSCPVRSPPRRPRATRR